VLTKQFKHKCRFLQDILSGNLSNGGFLRLFDKANQADGFRREEKGFLG